MTQRKEIGMADNDPRVELWERREVVGEDTSFTWMVWRPGETMDGDCHWFLADQEDEARALYARLGRQLATRSDAA